MFGRFFGSKNKAASADDDLSQVETTSEQQQTQHTSQSEKKTKKEPKSSAPKQLEKYDNVKIVSGTTIPTLTPSRTCIPQPQTNVTCIADTIPQFEKNPDYFIHVHVGKEYSDKASSVLPLVAHKVKCHVMYPIVQVVSTMTFRNTVENRTIEGELVLPMPENATMTGYAMEVDGKLIDAVPVEKEKAKEVFESEVRAGNKVSMVEKVAQSNCFRTRIYPLPYNQDKTVQVKYQLMLNEVIETQNENESGTIKGTAWFPVNYTDFSALKEANIEFTLSETSLQGYETDFTMKTAGVEEKKIWSSKNASKRAAYFNVTKNDLSEKLIGFGITITKQADSVNNILLASENNYFMTSIPVPSLTDEMRNMSRIGDKIQVVWDSSLGQSNCHEKNLQLFKAILETLNPKAISFSTFSNAIVDQKTFSSTSDALKFAEKIIYDGGSNMLVFDQDLIDEKFDYCIAFTNGVHTIGHEITPSCSFEKPIYFVNTSSAVNVNLLKHISTKSGGVYLNANELTQEEILNAIGKPVLSFVVADFEDSDFEEVYPNEPVSLKEGEIFKLFGKIKASEKETAKVAVSFRYGSKIYHIQELDIPTAVNVVAEAAILPTLWAQQKIDSLSAFPQLFKEDIKKIGQDFRIVTDNTSLIVLETLSQYQKHDIVPPKTLSSVYDSFMKAKKSEQDAKEKQEKEKLERIIGMWKERVDWHKRDFVLPEDKPEKKLKKLAEMEEESLSLSNSAQSCRMDRCCEERCCERECCRRCCSSSCAPSAPSLSRCCASPMASCSSGDSLSPPSAKSSASSNEPVASVAGAIKVKAWSPDAAYCTAISQAKDPYEEYVKQRANYRDSPAFYLDVADYFLSQAKNKEIGVRILTNIAELELENVQLYRIIGYRLDQAEELELAEWVFEKVKSINGFEPQSFRDLALVKERMGKYEEAMELFNRVIVGKWDMRFDEIELTVATEMNHLLAHKPDLKVIDKRLIHKFDLDIRISMAWDTNDVDIDLHVQEPGRHGEHAYYGHNRTKMGGYVSRDFRQGYGPEEYMLKKAQKGSYKATTNYFSNHSQNLTGGTTVLCTFYLNYMRPDEKRQMSTIRLSSHKQDIVVCEIDIA